ncbi:T9SS type A sorting domain-containing protein [Polaribacter sp. MSW13]|uniref:T9SS type A sorting domain-containing protein n=1 Tax=Polaribacter marinus TaxID=2916838 RepID=A0A9X1VPT5_9FLAO|nr:choice-of-anchor Q domain-containing protein [Polaribacter marinus]MCI2229983.1 T9SS type A sorting domain-containing protein [Polaribacter marinus]
MKTRLLLLLLFVSSLAFGQIPTNGLVGEYSFTNGAFTDGANGVNFTQTGTALTTEDDRVNTTNNAVGLNGDYLTRSDLNWAQELSISFWVKTDTNSADIKTIIDDRNTSDYGYYIYLRDGKIGISTKYREKHFSVGTLVDRTQGALSTEFIADGGWHHIVATIKTNTVYNGSFDSTQIWLDLFIDGEKKGDSLAYHSFYYFNIPINANTNLKIASNANNTLSTANQYQDNLDDILFYNKILSASEIDQIGTINNFCFPLASTDITVSNNTETSFDITLANSGDYELAYALKGQPFSTATIIPLNGYVSGNSQSITGLTASNYYNIYVRSKCSSTVWSSWSSPKETRTKGKIFVNVTATGNNDGSSWVNAFSDLQDAIAVLEDDQEIWIAQGTYIPGVSDRDASFIIDNLNVKLYGGFNGTETTLQQRDFRTNETILSGDLLANDAGTITGTLRTDNAYHVVEVNNNGAILDGLTIANGVANSSGDNAAGAAIFKAKAVKTLVVKNCTIKNNLAYNAAGIYAEYTTSGVGSLVIGNCIFDNNLARLCTAFSAWARTSGTFTFNISNSLFSNNETKDLSGSNNGIAGSAGWIRAIGNSSTIVNASLSNNTYTNNNDIGTHTSMSNFTRATVGASAEYGGTINMEVANSVFWNNTISGGAIANSITQLSGAELGNITAVNSIDEDGFSKLTAANLTNTSTADPLFTDAANNDFTLQAASPAIDTGDNSKISTNNIIDLLGNSRIFNTTVDLGVYEFGASTPVDYTLTTNATNGSVTNNPSGSVFTALTSVELTATPDTGYQFSSWTGDVTSTTNPLTVTMNTNKNITAVFINAQQTLTTTAVNGSVTTNPNPVNGTYDYGTPVEVTAVPNAGYQFSSWTGDVSSNTKTTTVIMDGDKSVTANFIEGPAFVDSNATGNNDGTSWANAYTNLQTAISNTAATKTIWVAKGIYKPAGSGRLSTFSLNKKQKIYGGFNGTETIFSERDINANPTILSGDLNGDDNNSILDTEPTRQDNAYHVITVKGNFAEGGELNGFIITGGNSNGSLSASCSTASASQYDHRVGAAIYSNPEGENYKVYMKITNCILEKNTGKYYTVLGRFSPCGDLGTQSHVDFESCIIRDNYSASSANIAYTGSQQYNIKSYGTIVNSLITGNSNGTTDKSSALLISSGAGGTNPSAFVSVINTTIANNNSTNNKAVTINLNSASSYPVYFYNSIIYNNGGTTSINITSSNGGSATFANNIVEGGHYSSTNLDPMLGNDYGLLAGSPAIDAGDNSKLPGNITIDVAGNNRVLNTTVDIGAYEFDATAIINRTLTLAATNGIVATNPNPVNGTYADGATVALTATPDAGYQFDGWSGDATGTTNPLTITMDTDKNITAIFSPIQRALNVTIVGGGTVTLANGSSPNGNYAEGTVVTLTATPDAGYGFVDWSVDATGTNNPLSITIDSDKNITATFSTTAGVSDENKIDFSIFPNPTSSILNIEMKNNIKQITIYSIIGAKVLTTKLKTIDTSNLNTGVYLIMVEDAKGNRIKKRFVKQ